ncbi:MAG: HdeD family acid-resistance protein [Xanthobacteraceae bacterium]
MLVDGVFAIYAAVRAARQRENWGFLAFQGAASIVTAVLAFLWPGLTVFAFVLLIAAWSIVTGCLMLAAAVRTDDGRWWLMLGGAAATAFGILMILAPLAGAVVLTWWLGAFALVFGGALIILAFKLRSRFNDRPGATAARPVA